MKAKTLLVGPHMCEIDPPLTPEFLAEDQAFVTLMETAPESRYPLLFGWTRQGVPMVANNPVFAAVLATPHVATAAAMESQRERREGGKP